ncbi:hypothetical protein HY638_04550 [Candidatus Woesearchaeota archaeon]|nr:hypothetical protein [Candidatus Woesearchaeota archaeon]
MVDANNSILKITKEDLIDPSLFVKWDEKERTQIFEELNKLYNIKDLARILSHDETTIYQIRSGDVKPSTRLYFSFLKILNIQKDITSLILSSRNAKGIFRINWAYSF